MNLTDAQHTALRAVYDRNQNPEGQTFEEFMTTVQPMPFADDAVSVPWCGMWLAIETDGYTHS